LSETAITTLQHALARGLGLVFQLEESETLTEPVPSRENRKSILAFEATEGGAGVLSRLVGEPNALAQIARATLELMHFENIDPAITAGDPAVLTDDPGAECVKGCYRCLLSYYNQPDHELIDRTDADVRRILVRLARSQVLPLSRAVVIEAGGWPEALVNWRLPAPDGEPLGIDGITLPLVWRSRLAVASVQPLAAEAHTALEALGFAVVTVPENPGAAPPPELVALLGAEA
jgi:hypothetical protein